MTFTIATWNINSVRLRIDTVKKMIRKTRPDVLCLQETKSPVEKMPSLSRMGYKYVVANGQKGYNGVAIFSKIPMEESDRFDFAGLGHARHIAGRLENGVTIHNFYVPAGGDEPDREKNIKFGQKLDFLTDMESHFGANRPEKSILVGDLNIAPREDDVWSHKQLLKVVSHTPVEVAQLNKTQAAGGWVDITRQDMPEGQVYTWWSYRNPGWKDNDKGRRLDHVWATPDIADKAHSTRILKETRAWEQPSDHVPILTTFDV